MLDRWKGDTVCILASGPSLTKSDADYARAHSKRVIVVNETWRICPTADVLYAADCQWWVKRGPTIADFDGECWTTDRAWENYNTHPSKYPRFLNVVKSKSGSTIDSRLPPIMTGQNSAFQAMGLALWWGVRRVVFLGLDLSYGPNGEKHHHPDHANGLRNPPQHALEAFRDAFGIAAPCVQRLGLEVINCSRQTTLEAFPRMRLRDALP